MQKDRDFITNAVAETIALCNDPTELNLRIVKNNLAIFCDLMLAADRSIENMLKAVDEFTTKSGLNKGTQ